VMNIAGISNKEGNVFGMMPHPERAADEELGNTDGTMILKSIIYFLENQKNA
jgi:phosphoribosylformylglycinamidine synthase subunit PurQ / glutaminase